jgi:hypothetical protein
MATNPETRIQQLRDRLKTNVENWNAYDVIEDTETLCGTLGKVLLLAHDTGDWDLVQDTMQMLDAVSTATERMTILDAFDTLDSDLEFLQDDQTVQATA